MFLSELTPVLQKLLQQPLAFTGGFVSGVLQLNINEEPLSEWLSKQGHTGNSSASNKSERPQSINID